MTTKVNINRQTVLHAFREFDYQDFAAAATQNMIHVPDGARVLRGFLEVSTGFDDADGDGTHTISVGDTVGASPDVTRYLNATNAHRATALTALAKAPVKASIIPSGGAWVTLTKTSSKAATGGAGRLEIEYVMDTRVTELEAYRG
jgi:hypothetical protein